MPYFLADETNRELESLEDTLRETKKKVDRMGSNIEALVIWINNVATDEQLDQSVQALDGMTGRNLLLMLQGQIFASLSREEFEMRKSER